MRRILSVALLVTAVAALTVAPSHARGAKHKTRAVTAASQCAAWDMAHCQGSCPLQAKAAVATKSSTKAHAAKAGMCPVSDPSACPSSCPRVGATASTAVAAR